ncbi:helix-turn-helix domain-containing protein [Nocardia sp. NPDC006630]|uniref:TetR/AcrR family transcriptional regulator n=1 Tax=Nocardia sp. NPDC006630 TaxID=3157181 RepID=UPI0033AFBFC1
MAVKGLRAEYAEATRSALLDAGRRLFIERRYADLSAEEIARAARLTRGALYHHFGGKQGLFEAVFEQIEEELTGRLAASLTETDAWHSGLQALDAFLDECTSVPYQRIVLQEGPVALGWDRWRELDERHMLGLVRNLVDDLTEAGIFQPRSTDLVVRAIYGLLTEMAWGIAEADDAAQARRDAGQIALDMIGALRRSTPA